MQASGSGRREPDDLERDLRRILYRFDCPDAHTLGEYDLDMLEEEQRTRVAAHAADCDECRGELQTLRAFLAEPITIKESVADRAHRIVATLFTPTSQLAFGGLRGASDPSTRMFQAGDITITLGPGQTRGSLLGLVVDAGRSSQRLEGRTARLIPRDGGALSTQLDDLGNFEFTKVGPGPYALEIDLPEGVVVVEEISGI